MSAATKFGNDNPVSFSWCLRLPILDCARRTPAACVEGGKSYGHTAGIGQRWGAFAVVPGVIWDGPESLVGVEFEGRA